MKHVEYSTEKPLNREHSLKRLISSFITPDITSYDRNHGPIPHLSADNHTITIDGQGLTPLTLSMDDLRTTFAQHEVLCALQCAGNRRHTMRTESKEVQGIDWFDGAIMNCKWKGPRLRDVLIRAGIDGNQDILQDDGMYVAFGCYQVPCQDDWWYGASVKLGRCLGREFDVILALEMNDKPLSPNHGFPVRVVIPGYTGARHLDHICRWVKWLDRITVQKEESQNHYQRYDYKMLPPDVDSSEKADKYWDLIPPLEDVPVNSVVGEPGDNEEVHTLASGKVIAKGYAVPQGHHGQVTRVEVSGDGGKTWVDAELDQFEGKTQKWCWVLWTASVHMEKGQGKVILSRATDEAGNTQQEQSPWNLRGVAYNGYGLSKNLNVV
ncbi:sulfite oxidase [Talaromyces proteolyticus]|uniref:Sulfite oxidase n=1 Tax=Talaromyces proteolyticus TaxID=1131652 RepID=A0AAD4KXC7_9EURO|nr:sulfite oxidase [Talaromyces proteolyticus]KAH8702025.1 sulfite oxidase [Talaromyces proteolyticus]